MNKQYLIAETFVGAGGSHIGFKQAGFKCVYANDYIQNYIDTLVLNNPELKNAFVEVNDIRNVDPQKILINANIKEGDLDVLFGGVVCKGFSLAGVRDPNDTRNTLYKEQLRLVNTLKPKISIIENVPGMMNLSITSLNTPDDISKRVSEVWKLIDKYKGVKAKLTKKDLELTDDEKKLLVEIKKEKWELESILKETSIHVVDDIKKIYGELGYNVYISKLNTAWYGGATKRVRLIIVAVRKDVDTGYKFPTITHYSKDLGGLDSNIPLSDILLKPVTINDVLSHLDENNIAENDPDNIPMSHNHKTIERFKCIPQGKNISDIIDEIPENLRISKYYSRGSTMRLNGNSQAPTLVPGHSNFPVHPTEDRCITVREAAIISSFPKDYRFIGSHTQRCEEVGQAVPPILANAIAESVKPLLELYYKTLNN